MTVSVFVGARVDGFIARPNGHLDWLPAGGGVVEQMAGPPAEIVARLRQVATRHFPSGLVQSEYAVLASAIGEGPGPAC